MQSRKGQLAQILDQNFKILEIIFWRKRLQPFKTSWLVAAYVLGNNEGELDWKVNFKSRRDNHSEIRGAWKLKKKLRSGLIPKVAEISRSDEKNFY